MKSINLRYSSAGILVFLVLISFIGFTTTLFAQSLALSEEDKALIGKLAVTFRAPDRVSFDIDLESSSSFGPLKVQSWGDAVIYGALSGILSGIESARKELAFEDAVSRELTQMLKGWDFGCMFKNTFFIKLSEQTSFEITEISKPVSRKDIKKNASSFLNENIDAVVNIDVNEWGIQQIKGEDFTVFSKANVEIISIRTNKIIASRTFEFNCDYAKLMHDYIYNRFIKEQIEQGYLPKQEIFDVEYYKKDLPLDSVFFFPIAARGYDRFVADDVKLLRRDLKLAALEMSRALISSLGLIEKEKADLKNVWRDEYRPRPKFVKLQD